MWLRRALLPIWIQLNSQLLRLTGDARFGNELETTIYNHLSAAQHPRGDDWKKYFTPLQGKKSYDAGDYPLI